MYGKKFFAPLFFIAAFAFGSISVFAQGAVLKGKVVQKKGSASTPVAGVTVTCYNVTDFTQLTKTSCGSTKTDEAGVYSISGLSANGSFIVAVGGAGIGPRITLPAKPGEKDELITATEGDGKLLSKDEVWQAYAFAKVGSGFTEDQKKAQVEWEKRFAFLKANIKKAEDNNAKIGQLLKEGNGAYAAEQYDLAIAKYDEGFNLSPDFVGSAPVFLNNKATALKSRAVNTFNTAIKLGNPAITQVKVQTAKDLSDALDALGKSYAILSNTIAADIVDQANFKKNMFNAAYFGSDAVRIMVQIELVDPDKVGTAKTLITKYVELENDKVKKGKAHTHLASYLLSAGETDGAIAEFRKALGYSDKNPDTLAGLGLSLYTASFDSSSRAQKQEALNYMSAFLKVAPQSHKMRDGILGAVEDLTKNQKLKPQKIN